MYKKMESLSQTISIKSNSCSTLFSPSNILKMSYFDQAFREELRKKLFPIAGIIGKEDEFASIVRDSVQTDCPNSLFRYRKFDDNGYNIDAFKNDRIYLISPDKQNDPYDNLIKYNGLVKETIDSGQYPLRNNSGQLLSTIEAAIDFAIKEIRKLEAIACYTELYNSMLMWTHYSSNHTGFMLEYSKENLIQTGCALFPVLYSQKRFDATKTVNNILIQSFAPALKVDLTNPSHIAKLEMMGAPLKVSEYEKIITCMVKSPDWRYEREWRFIKLQDKTKEQPEYIENIKPKAIYYGIDIDAEHKKEMHKIAVEKGIKEYRMYVDYTSEEYVLKREEL